MAIITLGLILWFFDLTDNMVLIKILVFLSTSSYDYSKNVE